MFRDTIRKRLGRPGFLMGMIGCGTGVLILVCGVVVVGLLLSSIRSSDVFEMAMAQVQSHPNAVRALGEPIKAGFVVNGAISIRGSSGRAEMSIPVSGSRDKGMVTVVAAKSDGVWQLTTLELETKQYPDKIDLLAER